MKKNIIGIFYKDALAQYNVFSQIGVEEMGEAVFVGHVNGICFEQHPAKEKSPHSRKAPTLSSWLYFWVK